VVVIVLVVVAVAVALTAAGTTTLAARRRWIVAMRADAKDMGLVITGVLGAVK
jgi:hypothetical protein